MSDMNSKCRGMLIGLAVGDALGAPVEFGNTSESITAMINDVCKMNDNHQLPKGTWTDDTAMALCLADSLLECGGYDSWDVMVKYIKWRDDGYRSCFSSGYGIGGQTDSAITRFNDRDPIIGVAEERVWSAGNGAIMRLAPAVIAAHSTSSIEDTIRLCQVSARETHYSIEAEVGAEILGAILYQALNYTDKSKVIDISKYSTGNNFDNVLAKVMDYRDGESLKNLGGYVVDTIRIALWGFINFDIFEQGMREVLCLAGDTDTNAAVYGQLAGAYYGHKSIPKLWRDRVVDHDKIMELADELLAMKSCPIIDTRFEEDKAN